MKVYELMDCLSGMSAGDEVIFTACQTAAEMVADPENVDDDTASYDFEAIEASPDTSVVYIRRTRRE